MKQIPLRLAIACLSFGLIHPALAADAVTNDTVVLDAVDVSGSRTAADASILPQSAVVISRAQLDRMPASNLVDALHSIGGVTISNQSDTMTGSNSSIDLGGFGASAGQNTLILLNGRKLNTVDQSTFNLGAIPLSAVERIEVLTATGSILYGNGASGGVVNIVTQANYDTAGRFEGLAGEYETHGGSAQGSFNNGHINGLASIGGMSSDNYRDNNKSRQTHAFGDISYQSDDLSLSLTTLYNKHTLELPGAVSHTLLSTDPAAASTPDDNASDKTLHILPSVSFKVNDNLTAYLDTGFKERKQTSEYLVYGATIRDNTERTLNISPRLSGDFELGLANHWTAGLDYYRTHYNLDASDQFPAWDPSDPTTATNSLTDARFERSTQAIYGQDSIALTSSTWLTLGARHEWVRTTESRTINDLVFGSTTHPQNINDKNQEASMWSVGVRQELSDKVSLFANLERSVRYATVDEFVYWSGDQKQQTGKTVSLGAKWQNQDQYSALTLWQGKFNNEIAFDPISFTNYNLDDTKRQGVSLNSYWKLDNTLWLAVSGTYQEAKFDKGVNKDNNVPLVPRISAYARADWQPLEQLSFSIAERYQGKQYMDNDQDNKFGKRIPSYRWMDLSVTFRPTGAKSIYLSTILHNAENRKVAYDYAVASTSTPGVYNAYPLPGRYLIVKAGVDF